jgi:C-terminal processing protease CtpA/Prc
MKLFKLFLVFSFFISLVGCEKIFLENDLASSNPKDNFEYLWNEADKKYGYFELKNIDWDAIKLRYSDSISDGMSEQDLFRVLASMLNELRDDHTNLFSPFNVSQFNVAINYPKSFLERTLDEYYLVNPNYTGAFKHGFLDNGRVAYVRYGSFLSEVKNEDLDIVLSKYSNTKGMIFDIRENGGGNVFNIPLILERFASERTLAAYSITRNGEDRNDFSEPVPFYLNKYDGLTYTKPVIVLCDRGTYSAGTFFSLLTKAFDHIKLMGDTTGGGGGLPNGGQLPNGWTYRFSVTQILDLNYANFAESGVPPDEVVSFNWNNLTRDEIIDRAIIELNQ